MKHFLSLSTLSGAELDTILNLSEAEDLGKPLAGKGAALVFQKSSARTRNSMEMAVVQLGGHPVYIQKDEVGIGTRESAEDVARTLACYHDVIAARVMDHADLEAMAAATETPVINLLSDREHPMQGLADLLTIRQLCGRLAGVKVAFVGDGDNNVARSLAQGCAALGAELRIASPPGYELPEAGGLGVVQTTDPRQAVDGADIVYTDVWVSMGQDAEAANRMAAFASYQVNADLMSHARSGACFLHCLPARRGQEVSPDVIDGEYSAVWHQAENRMHTARGVLAWLLGVRAL